MKTKNKFLVLYLLVILAVAATGCGDSNPGISGQDYVAVEPIPDENGNIASSSSDETEGNSDQGLTENNQGTDSVQAEAKTYFSDNGIICTADRNFSSDAVMFFVNSDKTEITENDTFSIGKTKCVLNIGECTKTENSDGNVDITIVINGQIESSVEEKADSDGTGEFDFGVNYINFYLTDKYTGTVLLGKSNIGDSQNSGESTISYNGKDYKLTCSETTQWAGQQWDAWTEPSETSGYMTNLKWPFTKTVKITVPKEYDGLALAMPKSGTSIPGVSSTDNTNRKILEADYDGKTYTADEMVFVDVNSLIQ